MIEPSVEDTLYERREKMILLIVSHCREIGSMDDNGNIFLLLACIIVTRAIGSIDYR